MHAHSLLLLSKSKKFTSKSYLTNEEVTNDSLMIDNIEETLSCLIYCLIGLFTHSNAEVDMFYMEEMIFKFVS